MRLIDADRLLQRTKFYNLKNGNRAIDEIDILHAQTIQAIPIPDDATNGDMLKAMFPNMEIIDDNITVKIRLDPTRSNTIITTNYNWLGAPYRREV